METVFEKMGGQYTRRGDYLLPNLALPSEEENIVLGRFGMAHKKYLKESKRILYSELMISGNLFLYCKEVEDRVVDMLYILMHDMTKNDR